MSDGPIRVALAVGCWFNYGVETLTLNLCRNIDRNRVQFDFLINSKPCGDVPEDEIAGIGGRVIYVPPYTDQIAYQREVQMIFKEGGYHIVHAHTSTLCVLPLRAAKLAGVPIRIAHCHTMASRGEPLKSAVKYALRTQATRYPTHYAASSLMAGKWLFGDKGTVENGMYYLPVARDVGSFRFDADRRSKMRTELGVEGRLVVGHLGRFVQQKNHRFLLEAFRAVKEIRPDALLLLAGDGPLVDETLSYASELGVADDVCYLGRRSDAPDLYQAMDVFCLPSLYEGVPGTGVEAQAAGLPFVYADTITEEASILPSATRLPLGDPAVWGKAIAAVADLPREDTYQRMTEAGYNIVQAAADLTEWYELLDSASGQS